VRRLPRPLVLLQKTFSCSARNCKRNQCVAISKRKQSSTSISSKESKGIASNRGSILLCFRPHSTVGQFSESHRALLNCQLANRSNRSVRQHHHLCTGVACWALSLTCSSGSRHARHSARVTRVSDPMIFCFVTCLIERKPFNKEFRLFIIAARAPRISRTPFHNHWQFRSSFAPLRQSPPSTVLSESNIRARSGDPGRCRRVHRWS
jgi:hypothetical protein